MKVAVLGATGSIGQNTLNIAAAFPGKLEITGLTCRQNVEQLAKDIARFQPLVVAVAGPNEQKKLSGLLTEMGIKSPDILHGPQGQAQAASQSGADIVVSAIVGEAGLIPTHAAINKGQRVALANKESLVMAGDILIPLARKTKAQITPVDSEHSAIFQVLGGLTAPNPVRRLILTASGGPFRGMKKADLEKVTLAATLNHPRWSMGPKISCDSATMMNKGLEIIEAHHLFGIPYDRLEVLVHPQSVVHSIVEYMDGAQLMQCGPTDMRQAIAYALSYPARWPLLSGNDEAHCEGLRPLDLAAVASSCGKGHLAFEEPDYETFPALELAVKAGKAGGTVPAIMNGANEEAVKLFLDGAIRYVDIVRLVDQVMQRLPGTLIRDIEQLLLVSEEARRLARSMAVKISSI